MNSKLFCENLSASYGDKKILNNISIEVNQGEFVALCGLNGIGKSTLLSLLAGLENPGLKAHGDVMPTLQLDNSLYHDVIECPRGKVDGRVGVKTPEKANVGAGGESKSPVVLISSLPRKKCAQMISYMQQSEYSIWDFSVFDFILQGRYPYSNHGLFSKSEKSKVDQIIQELDLGLLRDRNVHSLSGGEMQKVKIARALAQEPLFIILDEPSANLDVVFEPRLLQLLKDLTKSKNIGVLISIHDINIPKEFADKICLLSDKGLLSGKYDDIMTIENLRETYGADFQWTEKKYFQLLQ